MTTLQEYLNNKYPTREKMERVEEIDNLKINRERYKQGITELLDGGELDLSEYVSLKTVFICGSRQYLKNCHTKLTLGNKPNLDFLNCSSNQLTTLDLSNCPNLTELVVCFNSQLTSIDFLKQLPHPEKLT